MSTIHPQPTRRELLSSLAALCAISFPASAQEYRTDLAPTAPKNATAPVGYEKIHLPVVLTDHIVVPSFNAVLKVRVIEVPSTHTDDLKRYFVHTPLSLHFVEKAGTEHRLGDNEVYRLKSILKYRRYLAQRLGNELNIPPKLIQFNGPEVSASDLMIYLPSEGSDSGFRASSATKEMIEQQTAGDEWIVKLTLPPGYTLKDNLADLQKLRIGTTDITTVDVGSLARIALTQICSYTNSNLNSLKQANGNIEETSKIKAEILSSLKAKLEITTLFPEHQEIFLSFMNNLLNVAVNTALKNGTVDQVSLLNQIPDSNGTKSLVAGILQKGVSSDSSQSSASSGRAIQRAKQLENQRANRSGIQTETGTQKDSTGFSAGGLIAGLFGGSFGPTLDTKVERSMRSNWNEQSNTLRQMNSESIAEHAESTTNKQVTETINELRNVQAGSHSSVSAESKVEVKATFSQRLMRPVHYESSTPAVLCKTEAEAMEILEAHIAANQVGMNDAQLAVEFVLSELATLSYLRLATHESYSCLAASANLPSPAPMTPIAPLHPNLRGILQSRPIDLVNDAESILDTVGAAWKLGFKINEERGPAYAAQALLAHLEGARARLLSQLTEDIKAFERATEAVPTASSQSQEAFLLAIRQLAFLRNGMNQFTLE